MFQRAAADGMEVQPGHVYALAPNTIVGLEQGRLRVRPPETGRRERNPIDILFGSLATDQGHRAVGIVLSGGGSDGTLGLKAIKEAGGVTMAQGIDHTAPRHPSMPSSAIATGTVDIVAPVENMAEHLVSLAAGSPRPSTRPARRFAPSSRSRPTTTSAATSPRPSCAAWGGSEGAYTVGKEVRDMCIFSSHSLVRDPPCSRIDLVSCRNLLLYLGAELQDRVVPIFHYALRPGGLLFLGLAENVTQHPDPVHAGRQEEPDFQLETAKEEQQSQARRSVRPVGERFGGLEH